MSLALQTLRGLDRRDRIMGRAFVVGRSRINSRSDRSIKLIGVDDRNVALGVEVIGWCRSLL